MKFNLFMMIAFSVVAHAGNWEQVGTGLYSPGGVGVAFHYDFFTPWGKPVTKLAIGHSEACALNVVKAGVVSINPSSVRPTAPAGSELNQNTRFEFFSVNGGAGATVSQIRYTVSGLPGSLGCQLTFWAANDGAVSSGTLISGYDFSGFRSCETRPNTICAGVATPEIIACNNRGGENRTCADCKTLCSVPIN